MTEGRLEVAKMLSKSNAHHIDKEDLLDAIPGGAASGNIIMRELLNSLPEGDADPLMKVICNYIHFNSVFGGGVAHLAGALAVQQHLFRDPSEKVQAIADRSVDVASKIFFAAIDEFDDRMTLHMDSHRTLAQATIKAAGRYLGYSTSQLNAISLVSDELREILMQVCQGYSLYKDISNPRHLLSAIGFHIGSELLADEEFRILDTFLRDKHKDLVKELEDSTVQINKLHHAAYYWIRIHTTVEHDHFEAASAAANVALRYYTGTHTGQAKSDILSGVTMFSLVQARLMRYLKKISGLS